MKPILQSWLASSADPSEVSARVKGILLAVSGIVVYLLTQFFHITISTTDYAVLATQLSVIAGAIWTIYGFFRAGAVKIGRAH